jgi:hypothetical protein
MDDGDRSLLLGTGMSFTTGCQENLSKFKFGLPLSVTLPQCQCRILRICSM